MNFDSAARKLQGTIRSPSCESGRLRDQVFRTYFINNRGDEAIGTVWSYLDITPLGRQETWEDSPGGYPQTAAYKWWNWHDNYEAEPAPHPKSVDIITDPQGAAIRRREEEEKAS